MQKLIAAWMAFVRAFSWLLARLVVAALLILVFPLYRLYLGISSRDPLEGEIDTRADTYWEDNEAPVKTIEEFKRQY